MPGEPLSVGNVTALTSLGLDDLNLTRIELDGDGEVLRVWLNRPEARNAHDQTMIAEVADTFTAISAQSDYRVVVLGGRGKTFCAGADRKESLSSQPNDRAARYANQLGRRAMRAIEDCEAITVARVQGHAIGGGLCFGVACDFRVTTSDAQWYVPEVELGVPLPWGAVPRLIAELGAARARQLIMTADHIDGDTAFEWALAHEVTADEAALDAAVDRWVERLLSLPALALQMTKHQMRGYGALSRLGELSEADGDLSARALRSDDAQARFARF